MRITGVFKRNAVVECFTLLGHGAENAGPGNKTCCRDFAPGVSDVKGHAALPSWTMEKSSDCLRGNGMILAGVGLRHCPQAFCGRPGLFSVGCPGGQCQYSKASVLKMTNPP